MEGQVVLENRVVVVSGFNGYFFLFFIFFTLFLRHVCGLALVKWLPLAARGPEEKVCGVDVLRSGKVSSALAINGGFVIFGVPVASKNVREGMDWGGCSKLIGFDFAGLCIIYCDLLKSSSFMHYLMDGLVRVS